MLGRPTLADHVRARRLIMRQVHGRRLRIRRLRLPRQQQPKLIVTSFYGAERELLDRAARLVDIRLQPMLPGLVAQAARERGDSRRRRDAVGDVVRAAMDDVEELYWRSTSAGELLDLGRRMGRAVSTYQRDQLFRHLTAATGIDLKHITAGEPGLEDRIKEFTSENVSLIRSIPRRYFDQVESRTIRGIRRGLRHEDLAAELVDELGVAKRRAQLIARDQVGGFYAELNQSRQVALGLERYNWRTMRDNRVREEHEDLEGESFTWESGGDPEEGHPGDAILCRCYAEPDLRTLLDSL